MKVDLALENREEAGNRIEKSALAGSIRSYNPHQGPRRYVEGDVAQGQVPTDLDGHALKGHARLVRGRIGDHIKASTRSSLQCPNNVLHIAPRHAEVRVSAAAFCPERA